MTMTPIKRPAKDEQTVVSRVVTKLAVLDEYDIIHSGQFFVNLWQHVKKNDQKVALMNQNCSK